MSRTPRATSGETLEPNDETPRCLEALSSPKLEGLSDKDADFCRRAVLDLIERARKVADKARELGYRTQAATLEGDGLYAEHVILPLFRPQTEMLTSPAEEARAGLSNMFFEVLRDADKSRLPSTADKLAAVCATYAQALWNAGYSAGAAARQGASGPALLYSLRHVRHGLGLAGTNEPSLPPVEG